MRPQAKECQEPPEAGRGQEGIFPRASRGSTALSTSFPQNKKRVKFLLFLAPKFLVLYYSSPGELMQTVIEAGGALGDLLRLQ